MPTKPPIEITLNDLEAIGVAHYRSLARWSEFLTDRDRRPGRQIKLTIWDGLVLALAASIKNDGLVVPVPVLRQVVSCVEKNRPDFWEQIRSGKTPKIKHELFAVITGGKGEVASATIFDPARMSIWTLTEGNNNVLLFNVFEHARNLLERLDRLPRMEAAAVA